MTRLRQKRLIGTSPTSRRTASMICALHRRTHISSERKHVSSISQRTIWTLGSQAVFGIWQARTSRSEHTMRHANVWKSAMTTLSRFQRTCLWALASATNARFSSSAPRCLRHSLKSSRRNSA